MLHTFTLSFLFHRVSSSESEELLTEFETFTGEGVPLDFSVVGVLTSSGGLTGFKFAISGLF